MKIAILGANGHLAKCAAWVFAQRPETELFLFSRSPSQIVIPSDVIENGVYIRLCEYSQFNDFEYDLIFNGVGMWDSKEQASNTVFQVTEYYDGIILDYQASRPLTKSIHVSSGAAYGGSFERPVDSETESRLELNRIKTGDYYSVAKINSETKHRAFSNLNIVDIRLFGFFSRYMSLSYAYLLSGLINAAKSGNIFYAIKDEFWRDYIHLNDFADLLWGVANAEHINTAIDVRSAKPIAKSEIIQFFVDNYGLKVQVNEEVRLSKTGVKPYYYSLRLNEVYTPKYSSLETLKTELAYFMEG